MNRESLWWAYRVVGGFWGTFVGRGNIYVNHMEEFGIKLF
jgi:hypothetical protein